MTRSLIKSQIQSFNQDDLATEWEEAYQNKARSYRQQPVNSNSNAFSNHYNAIFSDDDDEDTNDHPSQGLTSRWFHQQQQHHSSASTIPSSSATITGYIDPVISSSTYHIHQADNALLTLKHIVIEDGWKKALKHKSGVMVHIKNGIHKGDRTPIFKGEAVIQGFSPQAIFYVIGMRKLWDEQYEDGNLVENLNDTTSLTYEVMKPTATSKSRDLALVEKIECTQNGAIVFACTSVETPRIPKISGRTRVNTKLQGWILEPLHGGPHPATKVTFVIQESTKGWVPGFAKKALARRPLVIAKVAEYLERKTERMRSQQANKNGLLQSINNGHSRRPSVMSSIASHPQQQLRHFSSSNQLLHQATMQSNMAPPPLPQQKQPSPIISVAAASAASESPVKRHISFADRDTTYTATPSAPNDTNTEALENKSSIKNVLPVPSKYSNRGGGHLYPSHRHPIEKVESIQLLKKLVLSLDNWNLTKEAEDGSRHYVFNPQLSFDEEYDEGELSLLQQHRYASISKKESSRKVPFIRADSIITGGWTAEQLCTAIHCYGARKMWDSTFEDGQTIERFSQKEYLVQWFLRSNMSATSTDLSAITSIETDPITGTVYTASTSVTDHQIPPDESGHRARAHIDLYGWVFRPKLDKHGRIISVAVSFVSNMNFKYSLPEHLLRDWIDASLQSITQVHRYLSQHGCPPYIRRVAGKVVQESFDGVAKNYQIIFIAKHQPSNSYRVRKQQQGVSLWCTDIRFHKTMFPNGVDIKVIPEDVARIQVSSKEQRGVKIFTTDESIDGKQVTFMLAPLTQVDSTHYTTYRYNGELFDSQKQQPSTPSPDSMLRLDDDTSASEPPTPSAAQTRFIQQNNAVRDEPSTPPSTSTAEAVAKAVVKVLEKDDQDKSTAQDNSNDDLVPSITVTKVEIEKVLGKKDDKQSNRSLEDDAQPIPLKVPKGYLLVPEHQNNNILIITDEISFNGQQISIIFLAMVVCYYMGKFTSCGSC